MAPSGPENESGQDNAAALRDGLSKLRSAGTVAAVQPERSLDAMVAAQVEESKAVQLETNQRAEIVREMRANESAAPTSGITTKPFEPKKSVDVAAPVSKQYLNETDSKPWSLIAMIAAMAVLVGLAYWVLRPGSSVEANSAEITSTDGVAIDDQQGDPTTNEPVNGDTGGTNPANDDGQVDTDTDGTVDGVVEPGETDGETETTDDGSSETDPELELEPEFDFPVGPPITAQELRDAPTSSSYVAGGTLVLEGAAPSQESIVAIAQKGADTLGGANVVVNMTVDPEADEPDLTTIYVRGTVTSIRDFTDLLLETQSLLVAHPDAQLRVVATQGSESLSVQNRADAILKYFAAAGVSPDRLTSNVLEGGSSEDDFVFLITNLLPQ